MFKIINGDCMNHVPTMEPVKCIIADVPDNIDLGYRTYKDNLPPPAYYAWLETVILHSLRKCGVMWFSCHHSHQMEMTWRIQNLLKVHLPSFRCRIILWHFTFGQYRETDCGNGYRPFFRFLRRDMELYPAAIKEVSTRQMIGDHRASPDGRVPSDVWEFPRVVGNSPERKSYHPTQFPLALVERIVRFSTSANSLKQEKVVDLFAGTGTTLRVCQKLNRPCDIYEIDPFYCQKISEETGVPIWQPNI